LTLVTAYERNCDSETSLFEDESQFLKLTLEVDPWVWRVSSFIFLGLVKKRPSRWADRLSSPLPLNLLINQQCTANLLIIVEFVRGASENELVNKPLSCCEYEPQTCV